MSISHDNCAIELRSASRGNYPNQNFCTTILWNEPQNHEVDCYFCNTTLIKVFIAKNKHQIFYADVPGQACFYTCMFQGSEAEKSCHKVYYVAPAEIDSITRQGQDNEKKNIYFF